MRSSEAIKLPHLSRATTTFVDDLSQIEDLNELSAAMSRITKELGFDCFVLGQLPSIDYEGTNFVITDYADEWRKAVYSRLMFGDDPVIDMLADAVAPFLWEEAPGFINPTARQREYIDLAFSFGLARGYAVPIKAPGEPMGVVSFATKNNSAVDREILPFTAYVATAAYRRALLLVCQTRASARPQIPLTETERRCLKSIARGQSDYTIARRLGVSTMDYNALKKSMYAKLGYSNKVQAVARGLQLGILNFNDALMG